MAEPDKSFNCEGSIKMYPASIENKITTKSAGKSLLARLS